MIYTDYIFLFPYNYQMYIFFRLLCLPFHHYITIDRSRTCKPLFLSRIAVVHFFRLDLIVQIYRLTFLNLLLLILWWGKLLPGCNELQVYNLCCLFVFAVYNHLIMFSIFPHIVYFILIDN